jgi:preprotein translocase subunit SecB
MTTNLDRARIVASDVALVSIALRSATLSSNVDPLLEQSPELDLSQQYRGRYEIPDAESGRLDVIVEFKSAATLPEDEQSDLFSLEASYLLVYRVQNLEEKPADALKHFAQLNGPYNVWPYWRELVQTVTGRIGLAGVLVPIFRPPVREVTGDVDESPTSVPATRARSRRVPTKRTKR